MKAGQVANDSCYENPQFVIVCSHKEAHQITLALCVYGELLEKAEGGPGCLAGDLGGQLIDLGFEEQDARIETYPWVFGQGFPAEWRPAIRAFRIANGLKPDWETQEGVEEKEVTA